VLTLLEPPVRYVDVLSYKVICKERSSINYTDFAFLFILFLLSNILELFL
jgi:hypothetical protein